MNERHGPGEEHETVLEVCFRFQGEAALGERDRFTLVRVSVHDDQSADRCIDEMRASHVPESKEQTVLAVPQTDDGMPAEHHRVRTVLRSGELGEDQSSDERLDEDPTTRLDHQEEDTVRTVGLYPTRTVSDRVLGLDGEQEGGEEVINPGDARLPGGAVRVMEVVPVGQGYRPPADAEQAPAAHKCNGVHDEVVAPFHVDERREYVRQEALPTLQNMPRRHVAGAVLEDETSGFPLLV